MEDKTRELLYMIKRLGGPPGSYADAETAIDRIFALRNEVSTTPGPDDLRINLLFDLPGPLIPVDYEGIRTGSFWPSDQILQIQVAVPEGLASNEIRRYLTGVLLEAVHLARAYVKRRRLQLSVDAFEHAARKLTAKLEIDR